MPSTELIQWQPQTTSATSQYAPTTSGFPVGSAASPLAVAVDTADTTCLLTVDGVLDSSTYLPMRDAIVRAALDEPRAVLVNVNNLAVPAPSAWAAFTSARWLVNSWPAVPIHLVCCHAGTRNALARTGVTRFIRVHSTVGAALDVLADTKRARSQAKMELPPALASLRMAREFVAQRLNEWTFDELVPVATVVVNVFVENVLQHTADGPVLTLETDGTTVAVSVQDDNPAPAVRREDPCRSGELVSGLAIVASMCRAWGSAPARSGKAVWALIGPEDRL